MTKGGGIPAANRGKQNMDDRRFRCKYCVYYNNGFEHKGYGNAECGLL